MDAENQGLKFRWALQPPLLLLLLLSWCLLLLAAAVIFQPPSVQCLSARRCEGLLPACHLRRHFVADLHGSMMVGVPVGLLLPGVASRLHTERRSCPPQALCWCTW